MLDKYCKNECNTMEWIAFTLEGILTSVVGWIGIMVNHIYLNPLLLPLNYLM